MQGILRGEQSFNFFLPESKPFKHKVPSRAGLGRVPLHNPDRLPTLGNAAFQSAEHLGPDKANAHGTEKSIYNIQEH